MNDHEDGPPNEPSRTFLVPPRPTSPSDTEPPPTKPDASPRPLTSIPPPAPTPESRAASTVPPPPGAEYFERAYRQLLVVHKQQMQNFRELHDKHGPLGSLHSQIELILREVRGVRRDFHGIDERLTTLEERADAQDARIRRLEGLGTGGAPEAPSPATTP